MSSPKVQVLLATYNGAAYLEAQVLSILNQDYREFEILVSDDGSTDNTRGIIERLVASNSRIRVLRPRGSRENGLIGNFEYLLQALTAPYGALSDQDDIWLPNKLSTAMTSLTKLEADKGSTIPALVFTDLVVADEQAKPIFPSFHQRQGLRPRLAGSWKKNLALNCVTGCTVVLNRSAAVRSLPFPPSGILHDHWLACVSARYGIVSFVPAALILYRQHASNQVGATILGWEYYQRKMHTLGRLLAIIWDTSLRLGSFWDFFVVVFWKLAFNVRRLIWRTSQ